MNDLQKTIYLASTDPIFRQALQTDPETATVSQGLTLRDEELAVLMEMRPFFARQPATWLSGQMNDDVIWSWIGSPPFTNAALA